MKLLPSLCLVAVALLTIAAAKPGPSWKVGAVSVKITPEKMMAMAGYASRLKPAEGVELDLFAKALVIEDSAGAKFALITMDLVAVPRNVHLYVAEQVQKRFGIPISHLAINASHTHSGPEIYTDNAFGEADPAKQESEARAYTEHLQATLVSLVGEAITKAQPASLNYSKARCGFAMNRRMPNAKGGYDNFPNPDGPVDHDVPVLKAADSSGKEIALVFGYACHCTVLGHQKFSGDYAGYAQQALETAHPGAVAMFMNGCSGDQNPYPRRTMELAQTHGRSLATAVEAALGTRMQVLTGNIRSAYEEIPLAYDTLPTREELLETQKSKIKLDADHATRILRLLDAKGTLPQTYPYPVQVFRLGDQLTWVTLGGEVVVDYSLRLKSELHDPIVWVSGYTNDVPTYIPSLRVWKEGGYEAVESLKWGTHPNRWSGQTEEHIISTVMDLRRQIE